MSHALIDRSSPKSSNGLNSINVIQDGPEWKNTSMGKSTFKPPSSQTSCSYAPRNELTIHIPTSSETSLRSELVEVLSKMNLTHSWYAFVPSFFGTYDPLDAATRAIIKVKRDRANAIESTSDAGI